MSKFLAYLIAGLSLLGTCSVLADDADPTTQERVGYGLSRARSAAQGDRQALASLRTDAAIPDAAAEFGLGEYYLLIKDYPQSVAWLRKSADQGFAGGCYGLGKAYQFGLGLSVDYGQAMRLYLQATALPEAEMRIGDLYANGQGVEEDSAQALSWYKKAAEDGSILAADILGLRYETGRDIKEDDSQAMHWYRKAADLGDATGQYFVGHMYERPGPLQDYRQAAEWLQKASQQGVADAQYSLGMLYSSGRGVTADAEKAVQQFQMAANQGQPQAQIHLAESFVTGAGVPADPFRAYEWFAIAEPSLTAGEPDYVLAEKRMTELTQKLSRTQVTQAKQAAIAWRNKLRDNAKPLEPVF